MQIGATLMLLRVFSLRNFAVGNTFAKTETVQAALFGLVLLGDRLGALAMAGIVAQPRRDRAALDRHRGRRAGRSTGRRRSGSRAARPSRSRRSPIAARRWRSSGAPGALMRPAFTLACVTLVQTLC